jgi:hypothetical protein
MLKLSERYGLKSASALMCFFALIIFFVFLLAQHWQVFLYHDDWGLAVLSYGVEQTGFAGQEFTLSKALAFSAQLYEHWTGRVSSLFLLVYAQKLGLEFVRVLQSVVILSAVALAAKIGCLAGEGRMGVTLIGGILLYLALPVYALAGGVYWFSASSAYLWGVPLFFLGVYFIAGDGELRAKSAFVLALAATFHEEMAFAGVGFLLLYLAFFIPKRRSAIVAYLVKTIPFALLSIVTVFAPGNWQRMAANAGLYNENSLVQIAGNNIASLSDLLFWPRWDNVFLWGMALSGLLLLIFVAKNKIANTHVIVGLAALLAVCGVLFYHYDAKILFALFFITFYSLLLVLAGFRFPRGPVIVAVHGGALCSLIPLVFAPTFWGRSVIPFLFIEFPPVLFSAAITSSRLAVGLGVVPAVVFAVLAIKNALFVFEGYAANREINLVNDCKLRAASYEATTGEPMAPVRLFKLERPKFAETMPYERPLIEVWMKKYYKLPSGLVFEWR